MSIDSCNPEYFFRKCEIAIEYANVLSEERKALLLEAIYGRKISAVGIYAYNEENKRVAEVEIAVDWEKQQQSISTFGELFDDGQTGLDYTAGEATETRIVYEFSKNAKQMGLKLSMWVLPSKTITEDERDVLLKKIGFTGGKPDPWIGETIDYSLNACQQEALFVKKEGEENG